MAEPTRVERRRRSNRLRTVAIVVVVLVIAVGVGVFALTRGGDDNDHDRAARFDHHHRADTDRAERRPPTSAASSSVTASVNGKDDPGVRGARRERGADQHVERAHRVPAAAHAARVQHHPRLGAGVPADSTEQLDRLGEDRRREAVAAAARMGGEGRPRRLQGHRAAQRRRRLRDRRRHRVTRSTPRPPAPSTSPIRSTCRSSRAPGTARSRSGCRATPTCSPSSAAATARSRCTAPTTPVTSVRPSRTDACGSRTPTSCASPPCRSAPPSSSPDVRSPLRPARLSLAAEATRLGHGVAWSGVGAARTTVVSAPLRSRLSEGVIGTGSSTVRVSTPSSAARPS